MYFKDSAKCSFVVDHRTVLVLMLTFCLLTSAFSQHLKDLVDPADTSSAIDLAEVPLAVDLFRNAALAVQDVGLREQFSDEFHNLQREIDQSLSDPSLGCLLKVRMFVSPEGAIAIPGGILIAFEGIGKSPMDVLVGSRQTGAIVAKDSLSPPFENHSYYIWIKKEHGKLKAGHVPREWREELEKQADDEFTRRTNLAKVDEAMKSAEVDTVSRDKYWSDMAQKHLVMLRDNAERRKVQELVLEFATAQRRFNEACEQYLQKEQELRNQQERLQTLQTISRICGVVSTAIQLGKLASTDNSNASVTAPSSGSQDATKVMIEYHEKQVDGLRGGIREWGGQMEIRGATLQQLNDELVNTFQRNGVRVPESDQKLVLPPKR